MPGLGCRRFSKASCWRSARFSTYQLADRLVNEFGKPGTGLKPCLFGTQSSSDSANSNVITYRVRIARVFGTGGLTLRGDNSPSHPQ